MARNKQSQKKKKEAFAANRPPPERRTERRKGTSSAGRVPDDESLLEARQEAIRQSAQKASSQSLQIKHQRRYDYLIASEMVSGLEVRLSESPSPSKCTRITDDLSSGIAQASTSGSGKSRKKSSSRLRYYSTVGFSYQNTAARRECDAAQESFQVHSSGMDATPEVVLPASDGRAEVVLDRRGIQPDLVTSWPIIHDSVSTWGLGYVQEEFPGLDMGDAVEQKEGQEAAGYAVEESSGEEHAGYATEERSAEEVAGHPVEEMSMEDQVGDAFETLPQRPQEVRDSGSCLGAMHGRSSDCATDVVFTKANRKSRGRNDGYLSIGGVKIFTTDLLAVSNGEDQGKRIAQGPFSEDEDEEDGLEDWLAEFHSREQSRHSRKGRMQQQTFNPYRARALDSSEGDESSPLTDSDIDHTLMEDYLANCEGLVVDLDDPVWVKSHANSLRQVPIEDMPLQNMESGSSETSSVEDLDNEDDIASESFNDSEGSEHCYTVTAGEFGRRVTFMGQKRKSKNVGDETLFGYDSDSSCSDEGNQQERTCSDDEARMRDLELDGKARMRVLELKDCTEDIVGLGESIQAHKKKKPLTRQFFVSSEGFDSHEIRGGIASTSVICDEDVSDMTFSATQIWPVSRGGRKVKKVKGVPGKKKQERKETIATKRRERALQRGFDLSAVNKTLEDMVVKKKDIIAFEPMTRQDRAQVHRIASIYGLKSGSQGSAKKRFVVVSITRNTSMPSGDDKLRLLKLLGKSVRTTTRPETIQSGLTGEERRMFTKTKRAALQALHGLQTPGNGMRRQGSNKPTPGKTPGVSKGRSQHISRDGQKSSPSMKRNSGKKKAVVYANNPVSFTAKGVMGEDHSRPMQSSTNVQQMQEIVGSSRAVVHRTVTHGDFATFEAHTKGFGSRMMAKMGYMEGLGLGRDKQGIAEPVEAIKRPKSLGLGANV